VRGGNSVKESFSSFCTAIGLPLKNDRWSWSAANDERRRAIFTIWEDRLDQRSRDRIDLSWLNDPTRTENGAREFRRVMSKVLDEGYEAYGILCEAKDPDAQPRKRRKFEREILVMNVARVDGRTVAVIRGKVSPEAFVQDSNIVDRMFGDQSAIDDIDQANVGNSDPEYRKRMAGTYSRDAKVRYLVLKRARGRCEECGDRGFLKRDGKPYLETHHVISLSEQGPDRPYNVIALCANDHRRAHFADNWIELQERFLEKLQKYRLDL
jgi:5-methylcytosine-specific restriction enzyme A